MATTNQSKRVNFSRMQKHMPYPDFLDIQLKSFHDFVQMDFTPEQRRQEGLFKVFNENFPINDTRNSFTLEFLKPKAEERYSKLEAYCDLLSKASSGAYQSPGTDGALQLLPGQFVATISELARQWQWQRATVRQFISGLTKLGQLSVEPCSRPIRSTTSSNIRL